MTTHTLTVYMIAVGQETENEKANRFITLSYISW